LSRDCGAVEVPDAEGQARKPNYLVPVDEAKREYWYDEQKEAMLVQAAILMSLKPVSNLESRIQISKQMPEVKFEGKAQPPVDSSLKVLLGTKMAKEERIEKTGITNGALMSEIEAESSSSYDSSNEDEDYESVLLKAVLMSLDVEGRISMKSDRDPMREEVEEFLNMKKIISGKHFETRNAKVLRKPQKFK